MPVGHYEISVYLPHPIQDSSLVQTLRTQWSSAFGGTTAYTAEGTYLNDDPEPVTVIRIFVPKTFGRADVIDYFTRRREELATTFPDQESFLVTFSDGPEFL